MSLSLTCQQARALVSDYINGELDQELAHVLERHLQTCASCPPLYAGLISLRRRLHELQRTTSSSSVGARIAQKVRQALSEE
ncbi:MAG: hypothetical protein NVS4B12_13080 [Ktedonobacteraceae bacterium]